MLAPQRIAEALVIAFILMSILLFQTDAVNASGDIRLAQYLTWAWRGKASGAVTYCVLVDQNTF
jgi:hypothetical protein